MGEILYYIAPYASEALGADYSSVANGDGSH